MVPEMALSTLVTIRKLSIYFFFFRFSKFLPCIVLLHENCIQCINNFFETKLDDIPRKNEKLVFSREALFLELQFSHSPKMRSNALDDEILH